MRNVVADDDDAIADFLKVRDLEFDLVVDGIQPAILGGSGCAAARLGEYFAEQRLAAREEHAGRRHHVDVDLTVYVLPLAAEVGQARLLGGLVVGDRPVE